MPAVSELESRTPVASVTPEAPTALPVVGRVWHQIYLVREEFSSTRTSGLWRALKNETDDVFLRLVGRSVDGGRERTWERLMTISHPHLLQAHEEIAVEGGRMEVSAASSGMPFSKWRAESKFDAELVERMVRPLAGAIEALHEQGLVHLRIQPDTVFLEQRNGAFHFWLGGTEAATLFDQDQLIHAAVDPRYAPPEAGGLFQHTPGPTLRAWDWWSLGRLVQELILGRHVVGHILQRDVSRATPELTARAEALLLERDEGGTRAGAVEAMPALDKRIDLLLRGLLTGARDARWGHAQVRAWLSREPVKEHYRLSRHERMFRWRDGAHVVSDAAELLRSKEHWQEGITHVWETDRPDTLAHFLDQSQAHRPLRKKHDELLSLARLEAFKPYPAEAVREAVAAVALLELAGAQLRWRGILLDTAGFAALLAKSATDTVAMGVARALTLRPLTSQIERNDPEAARMLTEFGNMFAAAEELAIKRGWLTRKDQRAIARMFPLAGESLPVLLANREKMLAQYACSTDSAMERLFHSEQIVAVELVVLAWAGGDAARRGFLTHRQWAERELVRLRQRGTELATQICWLRLGRALGAGLGIFGPWKFASAIWALTALFTAAIWPGPHWLAVALFPAAVAAGARFAVARWVRGKLAQAIPKYPPWTWHDGVARCRAAAAVGGTVFALRSTERLLTDVNADIAKLTAIQPPPEPIAPPPTFNAVLAVSLAGWLMFGGVFLGGVCHIRSHPPSWQEFVLAWFPPPPAAGVNPDGSPLGEGEEGKPGNAEQPPGPSKISWPYRISPIDTVHVLIVTDSYQASAEQLSIATTRAKAMLEPYKPETVNTSIFIQVPVDTGYGYMIWDGPRHQLDGMRVYLSGYAPLPRTWIEVGGRKGIFIDN